MSFDNWIETLSGCDELTVDQIALMNKAWDAALEFSRPTELPPPCDNAHVAPGCERFPESPGTV